MRRIFLVLFVLSALWLTACGETESTTGLVDDSGIAQNEEYGKPLLGETQDVGKGDNVYGAKMLPVSVDNSNTAVWAVRNQWNDTNSPEARSAGIAWGEDSGLNWEEKYALWIHAMEETESTEGYYEYRTFKLSTPWGFSLPAPRLECAETAIFLRATFASWYALPFAMSAYDGSVGNVYFGHFGIRHKNGKYRNSPNFKNSYKDYSDMSASEYQANWPRDSKLRGRKLSKNGDDKNTFLCEDCYAGAYFDEFYLNKRTGHFMVWLLSYLGSIHLASSDNAFHLTADAVREGDVLLERWQRTGIGHTLIVKFVERLGEERINAELAAGSMPRRQPKWEDGAGSKNYFTNNYCGGEGSNSDGDKYAALGGGIKRFRQMQVRNGYWHLVVPEDYQSVWIKDSETDRIAARIARFDEILGDLTPEDKETFLLQKIEEKRLHLRNYPASCAARMSREELFAELYELEETEFGLSPEETDSKYRALEDYVFAELAYDKSKTCCWNSSTAAMYEIIMDYNQQLLDQADGECVDLEVFKAMDGGYDVFKAHAEAIGRGDEWVDWSKDETCPQQHVENDTEADHLWTQFCDIMDDVLSDEPIEPSDPCNDSFGNENHDIESAATLETGTYAGLKVCDGEKDWYVLSSDGTESVQVEVSFEHDDGDIDIYLYDADMTEVDSSATTDDREAFKILAQAGEWFIEVRLYSGESNTYTLNVSE